MINLIKLELNFNRKDRIDSLEFEWAIVFRGLFIVTYIWNLHNE